MSTKKSFGFTATLGVMSVFLLSQSAFILNPALANIAELYPEIPYSTILLLSTVGSLMLVPSSIVSGAIAGTKVKYRTVAIVSILCILVGGVMPYFLNNFYAILATRVIVGLGIGLASPLGNALIMRLYDNDKAANMQGIGTAVMNISGIVLQNVAGFVCAINVNYTWLVHLIMAIPLVLVLFFMPEPEKIEATKTEDDTKANLNAGTYIVSITYGIVFMLFYPLMLNMSAILIGENIGTAATAGIVLSFYTIGGMIAGFVFGKFFKAAGKFTIPISMAIQVIAMAIGYISNSAVLFMAATGLGGFAIFIIWPACIMGFGETLNPKGVTLASGIFTAFIGVGGFLASPYISLVGTVVGNNDPRMPILVGLIGTIIIAVLWTLVILSKKKEVSAVS